MTDRQTPRYSIIFNGELLENTSREIALARLSKLTNTSQEDLLDCLFSIKPVIVIQTHEQELAQQYLADYRQAGLHVSLQPYDESHDEIINAELGFRHYAPLETQQILPNYVLDGLQENAAEALNDTQQSGRYLVVFKGQLQAGTDKQKSVENLSVLINATAQQILDEIFSVVPVIVRETDDLAFAQFYQSCYLEAGLKVEICDSSRSHIEVHTATRLTIRDDRPPALPEKSVQGFTYTLLGLSAMAALLWMLIYLTFDSFFSSSGEQLIEITLNRPQLVEAVAQPVQKPAAAKANPVTETATATATVETPAKPRSIEKKLSSSKSKAAKKKQTVAATAATSSPKTSTQTEKQQQGIKDNYYLQLLSWFAQYQQSQATQSKNLQGDITLQVTISRSGEVKKVTVLSSTSQQLHQVIQQQAYAASPFPAMPKQLAGSEYRFDLPLRYRLEK